MAAFLKCDGAARQTFQKQNAHKNTIVFTGDSIIELFVIPVQFLHHFFRGKSRKSDKDKDRKTIGVDGGGGTIYVYIYIYIYSYTYIHMYICKYRL